VSESPADATVLVVDDETEVADVYALRLRNQYETETAYGGAAALERLDDDIDVVLLDRRMPDIGGDEVLEEIRDRDISTRVIMITAVDPDFDIIEMEFDDYLCKPVEKSDLVAAIEQQLATRRYDDRLAEYLEVTSKLTLLKGEKTAQTLNGNEDVESLEQRAATLQAEMDEALLEFEDIDTAFRNISRRPS
jgi:DNA-binding response OmpR family regulator